MSDAITEEHASLPVQEKFDPDKMVQFCGGKVGEHVSEFSFNTPPVQVNDLEPVSGPVMSFRLMLAPSATGWAAGVNVQLEAPTVQLYGVAAMLQLVGGSGDWRKHPSLKCWIKPLF